MRLLRYGAGALLVAVLAAVLVLAPGCGGQTKEQKWLAGHNLSKLVPAADQFATDCGRALKVEEGVSGLVTKPASPDIEGKWKGPYCTEQDITDQWGHPIIYDYIQSAQGTKNTLFWSAGKDGVPYTPDDVYLYPKDLGEAPYKAKPTS